jgi:hypothetical protein
MKYAEHDFDMALADLMDHIKADYINWWGDHKDEPTVQQMIAGRSIRFERGRTYLKVISQDTSSCVHSFIVLKPTKGFKFGDILKAAGWSAPATNFARGNVLEPETYVNRVSWTGVV